MTFQETTKTKMTEQCKNTLLVHVHVLVVVLKFHVFVSNSIMCLRQPQLDTTCCCSQDCMTKQRLYGS
jgi:hypothetical protein